MATISDITTGEQSVTSTGAVTGSLNTAALTGDYTIKVWVRSVVGTGPKFAIEDTANSSAFSDATQVGIVDISGPNSTPEGVVHSFRSYEIPNTRFGAANTKLRINCLTAPGTSCKVHAWLEQ